MKKVDLTKGNVLKVILLLALPLIGSSLLQYTYSFIDMLFVGHIGSEAIATIGTSNFITGIGYAIQALVTIGCGIKVSHAVGANNKEEIQEYINAGFRLNLWIGISFFVICTTFGKSFIGFFNLKNAQLVQSAYYFLVISSLMMIFSFFNILFTRVLGSFGNNQAALKINAVGIILNIILDAVCIYIFKWGVLGAGIATLISNAFICYLFYTRTQSLFKIQFKADSNYLKDIIGLGSPMATQRLLFSIINILLARLIAQFGEEAIAAQKLGFQIESVALMVLGGMNGATASFMGQNYGAKKYHRIDKGYKCSLLVGGSYALLLSIIFVNYGGNLAQLFLKPDEMATVAISKQYLMCIGYPLILSGIEMISNGAFTGLGLPKIPARISIAFTILRLPLAYFLIPYYGVTGIWMSIGITSFLKGATALLIYMFIVAPKYRDRPCK